MARQTRAQALSPNSGYYEPELLATLVSAVNPDGTPYSLPVSVPAPLAADILNGYLNFTSTTGATTLLTVPAGRTWIGHIGASVACRLSAASTANGRATATFTTAGTGVTPAAGTVLVIDSMAGTNAATGTVGTQGSNFGRIPFAIVAPAGNSVTIAVAATATGTGPTVDAYASGALVAQ